MCYVFIHLRTSLADVVLFRYLVPPSLDEHTYMYVCTLYTCMKNRPGSLILSVSMGLSVNMCTVLTTVLRFFDQYSTYHVHLPIYNEREKY